MVNGKWIKNVKFYFSNAKTNWSSPKNFAYFHINIIFLAINNKLEANFGKRAVKRIRLIG